MGPSTLLPLLLPALLPLLALCSPSYSPLPEDVRWSYTMSLLNATDWEDHAPRTGCVPRKSPDPADLQRDGNIKVGVVIVHCTTSDYAPERSRAANMAALAEAATCDDTHYHLYLKCGNQTGAPLASSSSRFGLLPLYSPCWLTPHDVMRSHSVTNSLHGGPRCNAGGLGRRSARPATVPAPGGVHHDPPHHPRRPSRD